MKLSTKTVGAILERYSDDTGDAIIETASTYGEPGYTLDGDTAIICLGNYWCRCGKYMMATGSYKVELIPEEDIGKITPVLHDYATHHPKLWAQLEAQGVQFEWHDEWVIVDDKAYRTTADSYMWQTSIVFDEESGEYLTPEQDIEEWIEWAVKSTNRCIPSNVYSATAVTEAGFTKHNGQFESGWHPGQNDEPVKVLAAIHEQLGTDVEVLFLLDYAQQFDVGFSAYYRSTTDEDEEEMFVSLGAQRGEVGPGDRVICRGQRVQVDEVFTYPPHQHPESSCIVKDMTAIRVTTSRGDRWLGAPRVIMVGDRVEWNRWPDED